MFVYEKLLKGILSNKRKLKEFETIALSEKVMLSSKTKCHQIKGSKKFFYTMHSGERILQHNTIWPWNKYQSYVILNMQKTRYKRTQAHDGYFVANR